LHKSGAARAPCRKSRERRNLGVRGLRFLYIPMVQTVKLHKKPNGNAAASAFFGY
jgi:hypothetical protein